MRLIFRKDREDIFLEKWNEFINKETVSFRYLPEYLEYMNFYSPYIVDDLSFVVVDKNDICLGICYLPLENIGNYLSFSLSESYSISPLASNKKVEKFIFDNIDLLAKDLGVKIIKLYIDPLISILKNDFNYLLRYGFFNTSSTDCIVDLRVDKTILWSNLRKHYKAMINKILKDKNFQFLIMNKENADYQIHEYYRKLHHICSGRVTRDKKTFDKQFELLKKGYATLIALKFNDKIIGMQYFYHYKKTAVYASGVDDPEYTEKKFNIYHPILWKSQLYLKDLGVEFLEYSQPCGYSKVQGFDDYLDKKQLNISFFKRGMGAKMIILYRGIKYFDKELFMRDLEIFKKRSYNVDF